MGFCRRDSASRSLDRPDPSAFICTDDRQRRRPEPDQHRDQLRYRDGRRSRALSSAARHRVRQSHCRTRSAIALAHRHCRRAGDCRLQQSRLLRSVRAACDRQAQHSAPGRRLCQFHKLHDWPFARRRDVDLRLGTISRIFVLADEPHPHSQDRFVHGHDLLAWQYRRAGRRGSLCAASLDDGRPTAGVA